MFWVSQGLLGKSKGKREGERGRHLCLTVECGIGNGIFIDTRYNLRTRIHSPIHTIEEAEEMYGQKNHVDKITDIEVNRNVCSGQSYQMQLLIHSNHQPSDHSKTTFLSICNTIELHSRKSKPRMRKWPLGLLRGTMYIHG